MITLRQIQIFVEAAERGHLGRTAAALNLSQPAVSQQLAKLERSLDVLLFERSARSFELTPIGRELVEKARAVLLSVDEFSNFANFAADRPVGRIRFGVTPTIGPYLMPPVIAKMHKDKPDLKIYIREGIPSLQFAELASGRLDMMLAPLPFSGDTLHAEPLFREPLHIVAPPDDPLAAMPSPTLADFAGRTFLTLDHRHHYHRQVSEICERLSADVIRDYEGTSLDSLRQMVGSGVGLAILPELYIRSEAGGTDMIRPLRPKGWQEYRSIGALWRRGAAYEAVFEYIAAQIAETAANLMKRPIA